MVEQMVEPTVEQMVEQMVGQMAGYSADQTALSLVDQTAERKVDLKACYLVDWKESSLVGTMARHSVSHLVRRKDATMEFHLVHQKGIGMADRSADQKVELRAVKKGYCSEHHWVRRTAGKWGHWTGRSRGS